jgi:hypothetical protein
MTTTDAPDDDAARGQLLPKLLDVVTDLSDPEVLELSSLLDALTRKHRPTQQKGKP